MRKPAMYLLALLGTAACTADPTSPNPAASEPRYNGGGWTIGSGRADSTATHMGTTTSADTCIAGGGWTIGSGVTQPANPCPAQ
jgi:hypothetical protein